MVMDLSKTPKLIVMTDIHITGADERIIGLDTMARFCATRDAALAAHPDAAALILMGDLTHHGRPDQYARLATALAEIPVPVIPLIGNHDRRDAYLATFPDAPQTRQGHIQTIRDFPHHRVITLDTLDGPPYPKGHHSGLLCDDRLAWLDDALAGAGHRTALVFAHHPPFDSGILGMDLIKLANGDALLTRLQNRRAHLFCGHIHRTISGSTIGIPWTMFKSPAHQGVLDMVTPDSSLSVDEPSAYGVLLLTTDGVVAHSEDVIAHETIATDTASIASA